MCICDLFKRADINREVEACQNTAGAVLVDVRMKEEYAKGHIPNSRNIPLNEVAKKINEAVSSKDTPLFVYCHSGMRSGQAVRVLKKLGYANAKNIGGIMSYKGKVEV